jgi:hypothetical protein
LPLIGLFLQRLAAIAEATLVRSVILDLIICWFCFFALCFWQFPSP